GAEHWTRTGSTVGTDIEHRAASRVGTQHRTRTRIESGRRALDANRMHEQAGSRKIEVWRQRRVDNEVDIARLERWHATSDANRIRELARSIGHEHGSRIGGDIAHRTESKIGTEHRTRAEFESWRAASDTSTDREWAQSIRRE